MKTFFIIAIALFALTSFAEAGDERPVQGTYTYTTRVDGVVGAKVGWTQGQKHYDEYYARQRQQLRDQQVRDRHNLRIRDTGRELYAKGTLTKSVDYTPSTANHAAPPILAPLAEALGLKKPSQPAPCCDHRNVESNNRSRITQVRGVKSYAPPFNRYPAPVLEPIRQSDVQGLLPKIPK